MKVLKSVSFAIPVSTGANILSISLKNMVHPSSERALTFLTV